MVIDNAARIDIGKRFQRHAMTLRLLIDPGRQRLLHNPSARAIETRRHRIDLFGKIAGYVCRHDPCFRHFNHLKSE
jgi:hypothetical protein